METVCKNSIMLDAVVSRAIPVGTRVTSEGRLIGKIISATDNRVSVHITDDRACAAVRLIGTKKRTPTLTVLETQGRITQVELGACDGIVKEYRDLP